MPKCLSEEPVCRLGFSMQDLTHCNFCSDGGIPRLVYPLGFQIYLSIFLNDNDLKIKVFLMPTNRNLNTICRFVAF